MLSTLLIRPQLLVWIAEWCAMLTVVMAQGTALGLPSLQSMCMFKQAHARVSGKAPVLKQVQSRFAFSPRVHTACGLASSDCCSL